MHARRLYTVCIQLGCTNFLYAAAFTYSALSAFSSPTKAITASLTTDQQGSAREPGAGAGDEATHLSALAAFALRTSSPFALTFAVHSSLADMAAGASSLLVVDSTPPPPARLAEAAAELSTVERRRPESIATMEEGSFD